MVLTHCFEHFLTGHFLGFSGMFDACVNLRGFDFDMRISGDCRMTPYEARCGCQYDNGASKEGRGRIAGYGKLPNNAP